MKTWNTPEIQELNLSNTEFGSAFQTVVDGSVKDHATGNIFYSYSGTGGSADHTGDVSIDEQP